MSLLSNICISVRVAFRARFFLIVFWFFIALSVVVWMSASFSGRQSATVALDVGVSLIRLVLPIVGVLILQELISHEFQRRYFMSTLTYPCARHGFLLGRFAALMLLLGGGGVLMALALAGLVAWLGLGYAQATPVSLGEGYWVTIAFILLDLFVVLALGVLLAVVAATPSFVLIGTLGFMLIARSFAAIVTLLDSDGWLVGDVAETYSGSLGLLHYVLPDLGALDVRMIALYGRMEFLPTDWLWSALSCFAYAVVFLALAVWALNKKRFT